jgi:FlaA1/EpsC-like NDP-sugar epimerase/lipopolysaccharide/colanic/teichoic acid biosynthesis glycosyltransferase
LVTWDAIEGTAVKRLIDVTGAAIALVVTLPILLVIAAAIKLDSRGPILFRHPRVGRGFRTFTPFKFRTMIHDAARQSDGPQITVEGDARITRVGRFLRRAKLDEFPQLINILIGDMSFVGPRPEVWRYVDQFRDDYEIILGVRPGLTDPASFKYRNESSLLKNVADPEREYVQRILPDKIRLGKAYVAESCLSLDLALMIKTLLEAVGMEATPVGSAILKYRRPLVILIHLTLAAFAYYGAWSLRFDGQIPAIETQLFWKFLPWLLLIRAVTFAVFRLYQGLWRYTSVTDAANIVAGVAAGSVLLVVLVRLVYAEPAHPRSVFVVDAILLITFMLGVRLIRRLYHELSAGSAGVRVVVFGAGDRGEMLIRELKRSEVYRVVALVDDDPAKRGRRIHGLPVIGGRTELPRIIAERKPAEVLIAFDSPNPAAARDLVRLVEPFSLKLRTLPSLSGTLRDRVVLDEMRSLRMDDLLSRAPVAMDQTLLSRMLAGRRIMVTGAGGSIGAELCRQIIRFAPASLVMLDRYENGLHAIRQELEADGARSELVPIIADITDARRMDEILARYEPQTIFHAAAHKHVTLMEGNPCEAIKNNVGGTRVLAEAAEAHVVDQFIFISTDKAVKPVSVMGASKRLAERIVQKMAVNSRTTFSIVRFGNVLGSNGSVVPRFLEQIRAGGPVTITHPDVRRHFMLIPEAVQLVLHAAAHAKRGTVYVLEMGEQLKVVELARDLIRLSGLVPEEDIHLEYVGLRPGEKLSEELVDVDEEVVLRTNAGIIALSTVGVPQADLEQAVRTLEAVAAKGDEEEARTLLSRLATGSTGSLSTMDEPRTASDWAEAVPDASSADGMLQCCTQCRRGRLHRSRARNVLERMRRLLTTARLFRCNECGWRGWTIPLDFGVPAPLHDTTLQAESLDVLDAVRHERSTEPTLDDIGLDTLPASTPPENVSVRF